MAEKSFQSRHSDAMLEVKTAVFDHASALAFLAIKEKRIAAIEEELVNLKRAGYDQRPSNQRDDPVRRLGSDLRISKLEYPYNVKLVEITTRDVARTAAKEADLYANYPEEYYDFAVMIGKLWHQKDTIVDGEAIQIDQTRVDELHGRAQHGTIYGEFILPISYNERR